jgi:group I intron endonuclease
MHFVYKTINSINGKFYIGVHTGNCQDTYLGSGAALIKAISKYGIDNFKREILHICETLDEAYRLEKSIVTEELVVDDQCYNLAIGGRGYRRHDTNRQMSNETKRKLSESQQGIPNTDETNKKISNTLTGKLKTDAHKKNMSISAKARAPDTDETKKKKSEAIKLAIAEGRLDPGAGLRGKNIRKVQCPHCEKIGAVNLMKRYHYENCKEQLNGNKDGY